MYSLYAFHQSVAEGVILLSAQCGMNTTLAALSGIASSIPASLALFYVYDRPLRAYLDKSNAIRIARPAPMR